MELNRSNTSIEGISSSPDSTGENNTNVGNTTGGASPNEEVSGLSQKEISDPNKIQVTISNRKAPIVVLFGPGKCGKTMIQIRLARYLHEKGCTVNPVRNFRPAYDKNYKEMCDKYSEFVNNESAASSTNMLSFMLLEVLDCKGNTICQILEAPGEHYHSIQNPQAKFPAYISQLINDATRKIWVITLEPNWNPDAESQEYNLESYVEKIKTLKTKINRRDKVIFLYNKIDTTKLLQSQNQVNHKEMIAQIKDHFVGIFEPFKNTNPITSFWRPYNCDVLPFTTGTFNTYQDGIETKTKYSVGSSAFPDKLWKTLMKYIKG